MEIRIKPSEIVTRCLWDNYVRFVIGNEPSKNFSIIKMSDFVF